MPQFTISNVKQDLENLVHSSTLDRVNNLNSVFQMSARNMLMRIDPAETKRIAQITNALYDEVYDYSAPSDLKGNKVIDIRPQVSRAASENMSQRFGKRFDLRKAYNTFQVRDDDMTKSLRISADLTASVSLNGCNSLTSNGSWAASGDATNLTADTLNYVSGSASLNFDMTGSATTGHLTNSTMTAVDLEDEEDIGRVFIRFYIPSTARTNVSSLTLRWGSSSSAYWEKSATSPWNKSSWETGWNIVAFDWSDATETGSPDSTAVDYLRLTLTVTSATAETDFRLDKIACAAGEIWEIEYYSKYLFQTSGGTWQETTSEDTDYVNLDTDGLNLFENECGLNIAHQLEGQDSTFDVSYFMNVLGLDEEGNITGGLYLKYIQDHPSEAIKPRGTYYDTELYA